VLAELGVQDQSRSNSRTWVAALVLQRNLRLHDRDRHFEHLPQILRV
jgi:hypothetical protein